MSDPSPAPKRSQKNSAKSKIKIAADQFLIVGIGASAGGIQALKDRFSRKRWRLGLRDAPSPVTPTRSGHIEIKRD